MAQNVDGELCGRCGRICSRCGFFKAKTKSQRQEAHDTWQKYFFKPQNPEWNYCHGCADALNPPTSHHHAPIGPSVLCYVRRCAVQNVVKTCAHCSEFACKDLKPVAQGRDRTEYEKRHGITVPVEDYKSFFEPFEGMKHLKEIRESLDENEIKQVTPPPQKAQTIPFPDKQRVSPEKRDAYKALHKLLASLFSDKAATYAEQGKMAKRRRVLYNVLWIIASMGTLHKGKCDYIEMDGLEFQRERRRRNLNTWLQYFGLCGDCHKCGECDFVKKHDLMIQSFDKAGKRYSAIDGRTPLTLQLSTSPKSRNDRLINTLIEYAGVLQEEFGKTASRKFAAVDMNVLI